MHKILTLLVGSLLCALITDNVQGQAQPEPHFHLVQPGDTWLALSWRYGVEQQALQSANPHPNPQRQPTIGDTIQISDYSPAQGENQGRIARIVQVGILRLAAASGVSVQVLAAENGLSGPVTPPLHQPVFLRGGELAPREWPDGFVDLELSSVPAQPGRALALRAQISAVTSFTTQLNSLPFNSFIHDGRATSVGGTGAFFTRGAPELSIRPAGAPLWSQPWRFESGVWDYDQVTLTGDAAAIDQASIDEERARLFDIWSVASAMPQWSAPFQLPIQSYLDISSTYGARRSYNGGPYRTYHEGVDFSAYGGTPVMAPADGTVVLAEQLYVRGGAVIIDHGLGIYSGYYHLSNVLAEPGQIVTPGTPIGEVGTTGFSSGNHLHWDFLVAGTWVDAAAWRDQDLACWILAGWGQACPTSDS